MEPMILYVAGPMKHYPDDNFPAFHEAAGVLRDMGHHVICPAESFGGSKRASIETYARYDVHALLMVEAVVLLSAWDASTGACTEVVIAQWLGLKFYRLIRDEEKAPSLRLIRPESPIASFVLNRRKLFRWYNESQRLEEEL